jgi:predicted ATPase/KaiC/GvpD/RAD55 family RecA-like ATPase
VKEVPLVDRTEEMNVLKEAVYRAVHGEGGLVFIHGEAGIGKTRLVRELGAYARSRGVQILYGRCPALFRMDGVPPYILWKEVIKDYLETCNPEQLYRVIGYYPAEVAKLVPELSQKLRTIPQSFPISPELEQNRLFEAVSQFITNISRETPLLVVLDDLQWTDPSSLLLLHYLARDVQKTPLLLLGAYRSTDIDSKHPFAPVLAELKRERLPQSVPLTRMSLEDTSEMIRQILEQDDITPEFCRLVYDKTRGNPFFVEEVTESLKEIGVIYREENKWKIKQVSEIEFPETVKNVVKARLGRLDDEYQNVLTLASFVGNDFTVEALCAITGFDESKLLELMEELFKTGLIKEKVIRGEGVCSFADILVRDVVYEEVSPLKRKKLHGVVGCALEQLYAGKVDEHLGELASHFLESGNKDKALDYYLQAGERAVKIYANSEAAFYFESALELLEKKQGETREKGRVLERLGDIKSLVGEYDASMKYWNDKLLLLEQRHEEKSTLDVARLHRKMAHNLWEEIGDTEKAIEHQDKALKILEGEPESVELARLYADMGHMYWRIGNTDKARLWAEKALDFAKRLNENEIIANSCLDLGTVFNIIGENKKAVEFIETALEIALGNNYLETAARAYNNLPVALPPEETEKAMEYTEKAYELAKKVGEINTMSFAASNLASNLAGAGELGKALALSEESVALDRKTGNQNHLTMSLGELGNEYRMLGEWDKSEKCLKEAFNIAQGLKDYQAVGFSYGGLAIFYYDIGEYAKAKELAEKGYETVKKTGDKMLQWWYLYYIADMCMELGEIEGAQSQIDNIYKSALEVEAKTGNKQPIAYAKRLKAKLLRAQGKWEESIEYFEQSLTDFEAVKAKLWNVYDYAKRVLCEYAQVYLERNYEGDREKASKILKQALEMFQKMGAKKDIEKVEAKLLYVETGKVASVLKPTELVCTGYADLDKLLCGGLRSSSAVVLTSPSCNERDSLIKSFLKTGAEMGEVTFYLTTSARAAKALAEEFQSGFYLFVCNPQADAFIKSSPNVFKLKGVENLTEINIALTSAIHKLDTSQKGPRRACMEIVSDALLQHHAVQTRKWLTALTTELTSTGFTILAVVDPQMHPPEELHAILGLFEGEINICEKETEKGSEKFLKIKRMSNQKYLENELLLTKAG